MLVLASLVELFFAVPSCKAEDKTLVIGVMSELTSPFSRLGEDCRRGYEIAHSHFAAGNIAGKTQLKIIFGDNRGDGKTGLAEYSRMINAEGASAIITTRSPVALSINPQSKQQKIPLLAVSAVPAFTTDNPYAFRFWTNGRAEGESLADLAYRVGTRRAGMLVMQDDYFLSVGESFDRKFHELGGELAGREEILPAEQDFSSQISKLQAKKVDLVVALLAPGPLVTVLKKIKALNMQARTASTFVAAMPDVLSGARDVIEGTIFIEADFPHSEFDKLSVLQFGEARYSPVGFSCYLALSYLLQTITASQTAVRDSTRVYKALLNQRVIVVPDGTFRMKERELQIVPIQRIVENGTVRSFSPAE